MLTLVPTPIGNMADITLRALEVLREADLVACEDTRRTRRLLKHHGIHDKTLIAFFEHNETRALPSILEALREDRTVAVVSDGGTPALSDPGFRLVRAAVETGVAVTALPGPTACIPALVLSGLPVASFTFHGFAPRKEGRLRRKLREEASSPHTQIFYESPHRLGKFLAAAAEEFGPRRAAVCRELTKRFEEVLRETLPALAARFGDRPARGEVAVVIEGCKETPR